MTILPATEAPASDEFGHTRSAIQDFIRHNKPPPDIPHPPESYNLALQIAHNLRFQHNWTDIRIHFNGSSNSNARSSLPRPILSGLPPQRLYVHPDEQIEVLQRQREQGKTGLPLLESEREWVLPSHLRENWTLRRFAQVFDALAQVPSEREGGRLSFVTNIETAEEGAKRSTSQNTDGTRATAAASRSEKMDVDEDNKTRLTAGSAAAKATKSKSMPPVLPSATSDRTEKAGEWRNKQPKRILLATLDDDSTVVYYIVHDGIVKPRQN